jgi:hypothetical protein
MSGIIPPSNFAASACHSCAIRQNLSVPWSRPYARETPKASPSQTQLLHRLDGIVRYFHVSIILISNAQILDDPLDFDQQG